MAGPVIPVLPVLFVVRRDPSPLPAMLFTGHVSPLTAKHWKFGPGSLWVEANWLAPGAPAGDWAGLRIASGDLQTSASAVTTSDGIRVPAGASLLLKFAPRQPDDATFGAPPLNADLTFPSSGGRVQAGAGIASINPGSGKITLTRSVRGPAYDTILQRLVIPFDPDTAGAAVNLGGPAAVISGACTFTDGGWALATRPLSFPGPVFDAGSGGACVLSCGTGPAATWPGLAAPLPLDPAYVLADGDELRVVAAGAGARRIPHSIALWTNENSSDPGLTLQQAIEFATAPLATVQYAEDVKGVKVLSVSGSVRATLNTPRTAAGGPLEFSSGASLQITAAPSGNKVTIESAAIDEARAGKMALALSNALLTVTKPTVFNLSGEPDEKGAIPTGELDLTFGIYQLLPTLPDPYVANFEAVSDRRRYAVTGHLNATLRWQAAADPDMQFAIPVQEPPQFRQAYVPDRMEGSPDDPPPPPDDPVAQPWLWGAFEDSLGGVPRQPRLLLDISSNADQLGVCFALDARSNNAEDPPLSLRGTTLQTFGYNVHVFAAPQVAWEPVTDVPPPGGAVPPFPGKGVSLTDGERAQIGVNTVRLVPVTPTGAASQLIAAHKEGQNASALFTLPFGMQALAEVRPAEIRGLPIRPSLSLERPAFARYISARHFRLLAGQRLKENIDQPPYLPGAAVQKQNISLDPENVVGAGLPTSVLANLNDAFNGEFFRDGEHRQVPVSLIDLSGYGENSFSEWSDKTTPLPSFSQVCFSVMNGRTSREVVQYRSYLWPCHAIVVRTIVMERCGAGEVLRHDSGWVPTTPGLFNTPADIVFHKGAVQGMYNIRSVRETSQKINAGSRTVQAVYYDADVAIDNVVQGQNADQRVPLRNQLGFVQIGGADGELSPSELSYLLTHHGPVGGPMDCVLNIGGSGFKAHVFGLFSEAVGGSDFAVVMYGMPQFAGGPWSIAHLAHGTLEGEVSPVDPHRGVPLIRENGGLAFRFADAVDLKAGNPGSDYALLYSGPAHRVLFPRPVVKPGQAAVLGSVPGLLADPYTMLGSTGIFPAASSAMPFSEAAYELDVTANGLKTSKVMVVNAPAKRGLADTAAWALRADYPKPASGGVSVNIDPGKVVNVADDSTWPVRMKQISTVLNVPPFGDLFTVNNDVPDLGPLHPHLPNPTVILGEMFEDFNKIASALQNIGLPAGLDFSLAGSGMENQTYHLRFAGKLRLATKDGDRVDLGIGKVSGELEVGGDIAASLTAAPSGRIWFDVGGDLQQAIIPGLLYAGGMLKFHIAIDESGNVDWQLDAGTVASIGGDLIPDLVSLEATVHYAYLLTPSLKPGVRLGMDARASLVDGLVGVKFGVDASVSVSRPADPGDSIDTVLIDGDVMAMGQITVAWVFDPEFSRRLHFSQKINLRYLLFAELTGILPLPV